MLKPVNRAFEAMIGTMNAMYRATLAVRTLLADAPGTGKLAFIQAEGRGAQSGVDSEVVQEADLDHINHFGFDSSPPVDTELVIIDLDGGEAVIGERDSVSNSIPDRLVGDTTLYDAGNQYVQLDADSKIVIKSPVGNVEIIAKAGSQVKIGHDGATYRDIAYAHTTEAGASKVASGAQLNTWTHRVLADMDAIKVDLDQALNATPTRWGNRVKVTLDALTTWAAAGGGPGGAAYVGTTVGNLPGETLGPSTIDGINTDTDHSYVSTGSSTSEVEP